MNVVGLILASNLLQPLVWAVQLAIGSINAVVHSIGWSMVLLAVAVRLVFWRMNAKSADSILRTQRIAPKVKALQSQFKGEPEALSSAVLALYKAEGMNPLSAVLPQLVQIPIVISVYWAVMADKSLFATQSWLWIGSPLAARVPWHLLAANLASLDCILLVLYVGSMYLSIRGAGISQDPQAAKQQRLMGVVSPGITGFFGFKYAWPSAMLIYWLTANVIAILQQRVARASSNRIATSVVSDVPHWLAVPRDYGLFLLGKAYPSTVDIQRARSAAIGLLSFGLFVVFTQVGRHGFFDDPMNAVVIAAMMTVFFMTIMRLTRGSILP